MAENVNRRLEEMSADYSLIKSLDILSEEEIKKIHKKRENYEYKLLNQLRKVEDYQEYINSEKILLDSFHNKISKGSTGEKILQNQLKRVTNLYQKALMYYKENMALWVEYIFTLKKYNCITDVSAAYKNMLNYHSDKPILFQKAAEFELKEANNPENAKNILEKGIEKHPLSGKITKDYIICLLHSAGLKKITDSGMEIDEANEKEIQNIIEKLLTVYKNSPVHTKDINFNIDLVKELEEFKGTEQFQEKIIKNILNEFPEKEETYDFLAKRYLNGYFYDEIDEGTVLDVDALSKRYKKSENTVRNFKHCNEVYKRACEKLNTQKMWSMYIQKLTEMDVHTKEIRRHTRRALSKAFEMCHKASKMTEDLYFIYINLMFEEFKLNYPASITRHSEDMKPEEVKKLEEEEKILDDIFEKAVQQYEFSGKLWRKYMEYYIKLDNDKKLDGVFDRAVEKDLNNSLDLWMDYKNYYQSKAGADYNQVLEIIKRAIKKGTSSVSNHFKPLLLDYIASFWEPYLVREAYENLTKSIPCLELHYRMAEYEKFFLEDSKGLDNKSDNLRKCYENAVIFFGKTEPDAWLKYIKFEKELGSPKNVSDVVKRALQELQSEELKIKFQSSLEIYNQDLPNK